jgi:AcrR family transcriptional regulator
MNKSNKKSKVRIPVQKRSIDKKNKILITAYNLFNKISYDDISIRMIAKNAGISIGVVYSYFRDKREIFIEVSKIYGEELYNKLSTEIENEISKTDTIEESIYKIILKTKEIISTHFNLHKQTVLLSMTDTTVREYYIAQEKIMSNRIGVLFLKKFKEKIKNNQDVTIFIITKTIEGIVEYLLFNNLKTKEELLFREIAKMTSLYLESKK